MAELHHNFLQCHNAWCARMDREDHLWRRFAESGGKTGCRGCGGVRFKNKFEVTAKERMLLLAGAFDRYDQDPYLFHLWGDTASAPSISNVPFAPLGKRMEGVTS